MAGRPASHSQRIGSGSGVGIVQRKKGSKCGRAEDVDVVLLFALN